MISPKPSVLIVDDEQVVCDLLSDELSERGYLCTAVLSGDEALAKLAEQEFEVVLIDIRLPGMSGMEVLREIWLNHSNTATIMVTAVDDVATAVEAMKLGALDYIVKPFDLDRVAASISAALETSKASTRLDAIAIGVEVKLDPLSNYSKLVTERTIGVAQQLGIAEEEIQEWAREKARLASERRRVTRSAPGNKA